MSSTRELVTREALGFGPFLASLERRLDELPAEQLRRVLLEHGARLPAGERVGFLHLFDAPASATGHDDPDLLDDVESFVASIDSGAYTEGYGYDAEYGEYRTFQELASKREIWAMAVRIIHRPTFKCYS